MDTTSVYHGGSGTDDDETMTRVEAPKPPKARGPSLRVSLVLFVVGLAFVLPGLVGGITLFVRAVTASTRFQAPNVVRVHLKEGP